MKRRLRFDRVPHQDREDRVGLHGIVDGDFHQRAGLRVHGGFPELFGVHLAQPLVSLDRETFRPKRKNIVQELFARGDR